MRKDYFSSQVCEQLATDLVQEQVELMKHEVLVKEIKAKLIEGKQQLIKKLIFGKTFRLEGKKMTALEIHFNEKDGKLQVHLEMGLAPASEVTPCLLTRNEKQLLKEYRNGKALLHNQPCCDSTAVLKRENSYTFFY